MEKTKQTAPAREELTVGEAFSYLLSRWWVLLLSVIIGLAVGFGCNKLFYRYRPLYTSTVKMSFSSEGDANIGTAQSVTPYFMRTSFTWLDSDIFTEDELKGRLEEEQGIRVSILSGGNWDKVLLETRTQDVPNGVKKVGDGQIAIAYIFDTNTSTFDIVVSGGDKETVTKVAYCLSRGGYLSDFLTDNISSKISLVCLGTPGYKLENPTEATKTMLKYLVPFALVFLVAAIVGVVVVGRMDTRIKESGDVAKLVGVPLLGEIPEMSDADAVNKSEVKE